jgi:hypothetical protein
MIIRIVLKQRIHPSESETAAANFTSRVELAGNAASKVPREFARDLHIAANFVRIFIVLAIKWQY